MESGIPSKTIGILNDGFLFFRSHFRQIATLCLPFLFVSSLFDFALPRNFHETPMALFGPLMFNLLLYPFYTAALIHLMARRARGAQPSNSDLLIQAMRQWPPLFLLKALLVLIVGSAFGFTLMIGLGMGLPPALLVPLLIPGIWLGVRLSFSEFYLVLFNHRPMDAISRSFIETRERFFLLLLLLAVTYLPVVLLGIGTDQLLQGVTSNNFFRMMASAGWSFVGLYVNIVLFRAFMETLATEKPAVIPERHGDSEG